MRRGVSGSALMAALMLSAVGMPGGNAQSPQAEARAQRAGALANATMAMDRLAQSTRAAGQAAAMLGGLYRGGRTSYPRKTPDWTNARYRRASAKKRAVKRNRRAHRG